MLFLGREKEIMAHRMTSNIKQNNIIQNAHVHIPVIQDNNAQVYNEYICAHHPENTHTHEQLHYKTCTHLISYTYIDNQHFVVKLKE